MGELDEKIIAYLNGEAKEEASRELHEWICASEENAGEFAKISLLHGQMRSLISGEYQARQSGVMAATSIGKKQRVTVPNADMPNRKTRFAWHQVAMIIGLAAVVLIAFGFFFQLGPKDDETEIAELDNFATIRQVSNVVWTKESLEQHDRLGIQTIEFQSGILSLQFDNGVDVTLEGPARYDLTSMESTRLEAGTLVANVPTGAQGFRVDTPAAKVIDLGTSFGVNVDQVGVAEVSVFDGEVEVVSTDSDSGRRLLEGQSVRLSVSGDVQPTEFKPARFEKLWPIASGVVGSTDTIQFIRPGPRRIRRITSDDKIFLMPEGPAVDLAKPLQLNICDSGDYSQIEQLTPVELPDGLRVRSYLLQYAPDQELGPRRAKRITGSITFDQPVVGLIVLQNELVASSYLGRRRVDDSRRRRQLEFNDGNGDRITLSDDRYTVTVELTAPGPTSDRVRIVVDGSQFTPGLRGSRRIHRMIRRQK